MNKKSYDYVLGALLIGFGVVFILSPERIFQSIVFGAALVIILFSSLGLLSSINDKENSSMYLSSGFIIGLIFGIILLTNTDSAIKIVPILLGLWLFITGLSTVIMMLKRGLTISNMISPIVRTILGVICLCLPILPITFAGVFIGIILVLAGISTITNSKSDEVIYKVKVKK